MWAGGLVGAGGPAGAGGTSVPLLVAFYSCPELGSAMAGVCVCVRVCPM